IARAQRIIAERISAGNPPGTGNARLPGRPEPDTGAGRSWLAAARDARVVVEPDGQREEGREEDDGRDRESPCVPPPLRPGEPGTLERGAGHPPEADRGQRGASGEHAQGRDESPEVVVHVRSHLSYCSMAMSRRASDSAS